MRNKVNVYIGALFVSIAGAGAAMMIIHVAFSNTPMAVYGGYQAAYAPLEQSLLKPAQ